MLRPRVPDDPRSCQMDGCTISTNIGYWFSRSTCKKHPDRVSGRTLRWFCQSWSERERDKSVDLLLGIASLPPSVCEGLYIYRSRSTVSLFNGREIFCVVIMTLGGVRVIITLWAADRDRGRRSCEVIVGSDLLSLHLVLSLCRWRNVGHGRLLWWRARLAYFSQRSEQNISG